MRLTLIITVALLVFAACSDGTIAGDEPPVAIAPSGAASVPVGLGSYCWTSGRGVCAPTRPV